MAKKSIVKMCEEEFGGKWFYNPSGGVNGGWDWSDDTGNNGVHWEYIFGGKEKVFVYEGDSMVKEYKITNGKFERIF